MEQPFVKYFHFVTSLFWWDIFTINYSILMTKDSKACNCIDEKVHSL